MISNYNNTTTRLLQASKIKKSVTTADGSKPLIITAKLSILDNGESLDTPLISELLLMEHFLEAKSNLRRCITLPRRK